MFPWDEKYHIGFNIHTSIEYWECPCTIGKEHDYNKETIKYICKQEKYIESVELLEDLDRDWYIWEKVTSDTPDFISSLTEWEIRRVIISTIYLNRSTGKTLQAFFEPEPGGGLNADNVKVEWEKIKTKARDYEYAEQPNFRKFQHWPDSHYGVLGNNCHTFSKTMIAPHVVPDIWGYMGGNDRPQKVKDRWNGRVPVNDKSKLGPHP